jgi:CRISPR-associated protein Cas5h
MNIEYTNIAVFEISGSMACFKKFYSNKSSLTYKTIPRTVIAGILASILEIERNEYYELFSLNNVKIGINVINEIKTQLQCMNYLKDSGGRTQTRLEILMGKENNLNFRVYLTFKKNEENEKILEELLDRVNNENYGFGVYLGQRQFRGNIELIDIIKNWKIERNIETSLESLTYKENILEINFTKNVKLSSDLMSLEFEAEEKNNEILRIPKPKGEVVFSQDGNKIYGKFKEVIKIQENKYISFFSRIGE